MRDTKNGLPLPTANSRGISMDNLVKQVADEENLWGSFEEIIEKLEEGVLVLDKSGKILFANAAALNLFGLSRGLDILHKEFGQPTQDDKLGEVELHTSCGKFIPAEIQKFDINWEGNPSTFLFVRDITERKKAQAAELQAKEAELANRLKSEFLANMSHELRTPLNVILGATEMLESGDIANQAKYFGMAKTAGNSLLELISDILDLSKIEAGQVHLEKSNVALRDLLEEIGSAFDVQAHLKKLNFKFDLCDQCPPMIMADACRIKQIFMNLLSNAIKFTEKGKITLNIETQKKKDNCVLHCEVIDTGIGIPADMTNLIFEPFRQADGSTTRKFGGTGLGLNITKRLIEMMGGKISVKSVVGKGSTFSVELPLEVGQLDAEIPKIEKAEEASSVTEKRKDTQLTVMLVEDNALNIELMSAYLEHMPYNVVVAEDGAKAVDLCKTSMPDIILMDLLMPVMDGFEATKKIRALEAKQKREHPVLIAALTGAATPDDRRRADEAGCDDFLTKPISRAALIEELEKWH